MRKKLNKIRTSFNLPPALIEYLKVVSQYEYRTMSDVIQEATMNYILHRYPKIKQLRESIISDMGKKEMELHNEIEDIKNREK